MRIESSREAHYFATATSDDYKEQAMSSGIDLRLSCDAHRRGRWRRRWGDGHQQPAATFALQLSSLGEYGERPLRRSERDPVLSSKLDCTRRARPNWKSPVCHLATHRVSDDLVGMARRWR